MNALEWMTSSTVAAVAAPRVARTPFTAPLIAFAPFVAIVARALSAVLLSYELSPPPLSSLLLFSSPEVCNRLLSSPLVQLLLLQRMEFLNSKCSSAPWKHALEEHEAHVSDFGTAKFLKPGSYSWTTIAGTFGYAAPGAFVSKFVNLDLKYYIRFLNWMPAALQMPKPELIDHAGLDSAVLVRNVPPDPDESVSELVEHFFSYPSNGVLPQSPMHTKSLAVLKKQEANEESKAVTKASAMKAIKKRMEKDIDKVGKIAHGVKTKVEAVNRDVMRRR
ncbi:hypothetical protein Ahy_B02g059768 isoform B [Arachis hypogaea]|uniref:Syntaxin N-terminal domain-containing protein n=1 Tax=Arachis hypogaea TaxID=3818 RepID=A0A445AH77_ARAHY|nr:hypothetical protein Ahy_B02g059768 isoform B [Arachis hypogaea]